MEVMRPLISFVVLFHLLVSGSPGILATTLYVPQQSYKTRHDPQLLLPWIIHWNQADSSVFPQRSHPYASLWVCGMHMACLFYTRNIFILEFNFYNLWQRLVSMALCCCCFFFLLKSETVSYPRGYAGRCYGNRICLPAPQEKPWIKDGALRTTE